jgi:hypothetical protein
MLDYGAESRRARRARAKRIARRRGWQDIGDGDDAGHRPARALLIAVEDHPRGLGVRAGEEVDDDDDGRQ